MKIPKRKKPLKYTKDARSKANPVYSFKDSSGRSVLEWVKVNNQAFVTQRETGREFYIEWVEDELAMSKHVLMQAMCRNSSDCKSLYRLNDQYADSYNAREA